MRREPGSVSHTDQPGLCVPSSSTADTAALGQRLSRSVEIIVHGVVALTLAANAATVLTANAQAREAGNGVIVGALPPGNTPLQAIPADGGLDGVKLAQADINEFSVRPAQGGASAPIPLSIRLPRDIDTSYTFIMIRGLPTGFRLSAGFRTKDAWAVSLRDIAGLSLTSPPGFQGLLNLEVVLVKGRDVKSESRLLSVSINGSGTIGAAATGSQILTAAPPLNAADPLQLKDEDLEDKVGLVPPPSGVPAEEEKALMDRAGSLLKNSDVAAARLLYEHLAMRGSARGAFAMGQTYDPSYLATLFVQGLKGDIEKAKTWYEKAAGLGNEDARSRLSALNDGK